MKPQYINLYQFLKRGYYGTFHHFSEKPICRYVDKFAERHNTRNLEPMERFAHFIRLTVDKRLTYAELVR